MHIIPFDRLKFTVIDTFIKTVKYKITTFYRLITKY